MWITPQLKRQQDFAILQLHFSVSALLFVLLLCKSFPPGNSISHMFQNSKDIKEYLTPLQSTPSYSVPLSKSTLKKHLLPGIPWRSSGWEDPMLPMQGAWVWSLVEELRSYMLRCNQKLINKWIKWHLFFLRAGLPVSCVTFAGFVYTGKYICKPSPSPL